MKQFFYILVIIINIFLNKVHAINISKVNCESQKLFFQTNKSHRMNPITGLTEILSEQSKVIIILD